MKRYTIDKKRLDDFAVGRKIFPWIMIIVMGIAILKSILSYDTFDKTNANIIAYGVIMACCCFLIVVAPLLLLRKFSTAIKMFRSWDQETVLTIDNETIQITNKESSLLLRLSELTVENHRFYGGRLNPLHGLGYAVLTTSTGETIKISSLLFDLPYGVDEIDKLFAKRVMKYSSRQMSWFRQLPQTNAMV